MQLYEKEAIIIHVHIAATHLLIYITCFLIVYCTATC